MNHWSKLTFTSSFVIPACALAAASIMPFRIWPLISLTWPGPWGMNTVVFFEEFPRSLMVSKYWVIKIRSMTSLAEVPSTLWEKFKIFSLRPSVIACLCLATPTPPRYFASASASAFFTRSTFSASPLYTLASWSLWAVEEMKYCTSWGSHNREIGRQNMKKSEILKNEKKLYGSPCNVHPQGKHGLFAPPGNNGRGMSDCWMMVSKKYSYTKLHNRGEEEGQPFLYDMTSKMTKIITCINLIHCSAHRSIRYYVDH